MELAQEQEAALEAIRVWYARVTEGGEFSTKPYFVLSGYAGTGKTTIMKYLLDEIEEATCATMTGKAMNVLKSKIGDTAECRTIHNLLYKPSSRQEQALVNKRAALKRSLENEERKGAVDDILRQISQLDTEINGLAFTLKELGEDDRSGLIVVDEASMLSRHVLDDLLGLGRAVLLVGDDMQLPPVQGKSIFQELGVDSRLTEVHRQALDNPIITLATAIREDNRAVVDSWKRHRFNAEMAARADKVLCYTNKTRHNINRLLRDVHNRNSMFPETGDKLICVHNVRGYSMINGGEAVATGDCTSTHHGDKIVGKCSVSYEGGEKRDLEISLENFAAHYLDPRKSKDARAQIDEYTIPKFGGEYGDNIRYFDYGYAITVHKAQGSEYDKVFLYDDAEWLGKKPGGSNQRQRWLYTAVTRAKEKLAWVR